MPRIAYLTYSTGKFDGRTLRMARTALAAGYEVIVYARWQQGLALEEQGPGYRIVRLPAVPALAIPWRRAAGRRRLGEILAGDPGPVDEETSEVDDAGDHAGEQSAPAELERPD